MAERRWVLRVEGVNFAATVTDTNDLSTIRGSSLALLRAAPTIAAALDRAQVRPEPILAGASQAAFRFTADAAAADDALQTVRNLLASPAAEGEPPLHHLSFVADLAPLHAGDPAAQEDALLVAEARNRAAQLRAFTVTVPRADALALMPDAFDHARQAETSIQTAAGRLPVSYSVKARRAFGQSQRSGFYRDYDAGGRSLPVCNSFQDIVADPPRGLPISVRGKLAFLYGDGNGFGRVRRAIGAQRFADGLATLQAGFLRRLTAWLRDGVESRDERRAVALRDGWAARFETLLWGGDDFLFVMPAWLALPVLAEAEAATRDWSVGGHRLAIDFGLAICDRKTPVRTASATARDLCDAAKAADPGGQSQSRAAIQPFESQSPLDAPLPVQRSRLFRVPEAATEELGRRLVLPGGALGELVPRIRDLTSGEVRDGALSPGVVHRAIAAARRAPGGLVSEAGRLAAVAVLEEAFARFGHEVPRLGLGELAPRGEALDLCLLAMFRDYCVAPEAGDPPGWPEDRP